jgi:hypothetical protein
LVSQDAAVQSSGSSNHPSPKAKLEAQKVDGSANIFSQLFPFKSGFIFGFTLLTGCWNRF